MVGHERAVEIIRDNIDRDDRIPDKMSYVIHEADAEGEHANVSLPLLELQIANVSRDDDNNSTFAGYVFNTDGERVGRRYETKWEMTLRLNLWTADGSDYNVQEIGDVLHTVLFDYDELGPAELFTTESGEPVEDIWGFRLQDDERVDDFGQTPTVRRLRKTALVRGANEYTQTGEEPIKTTTQDVS